eukprot:TRINITY_DN731_c0_g2_i2.p1 TRINITY_DN731_c0_g2~~TRINITY_DN731_c0_g2_i2.p1  ORF type:complete len:419 (+),score=41.78 TRINITY_DN731_c0_g2_i2:133-1257(+)
MAATSRSTNRQRQERMRGMKSKREPHPRDVALAANKSFEPKKVALIVAGTLQRFLFQSTVDYVVGPMTASGIEVDYYLSLTSNKAQAYRADDGYTDHASTDLDWQSDDVTAISGLIKDILEKNQAAGKVISIKDDIDIDGEKLLHVHREKAKLEHPDEDPDLRFPTLNMPQGERTLVANRNLLKMHYAIQSLWRETVKQEATSGQPYDLVIFMRDDSLWLSNFNVSQLLASGDHDVYVPSCDAREKPMHWQEINDHILIVKRSSADIFGNYFTTLLNTNVQECMERLDAKFRNNERRGCNSEMLLKYVMEKHGIKAGGVPQSLVPFQRSVRVQMPDGTSKLCFHKLCQSNEDPLAMDGSIEACKNTDWSKVFNS